MTSNYYWRAVRRIAKRLGISISAARKKDWEKEANAERKRRSQAHIRPAVTRTKPAPKPGKPAYKSKDTRVRKSRRHPAKRDVFPKLPRKPVTGGASRKLTGGGGPVFEDEYDEEEGDRDTGGDEWGDIWKDDWQDLFPTLDDMDNLEEFLDDFEYEDSDKYKEPS